jgi:Fe-S oxidoreductase
MWIVRFALQRPYTFVIVAVLIAIFGIASILRTPTDILPDIDIPIVSVIWTYGGLDADDMSKRIVGVCERALPTTVNNIQYTESRSYNGVGVIKIHFQPSVQVDLAIAQVTALAQSLLRLMPPGILPPYVLKYDASSVPIVQIAGASMLIGNIAAKVFGDGGVRCMLNMARKLISPELLPSWIESLPMPPSSKLPRTRQEGATAIYFPACINRIFGGSKLSRHKESLPAAFVTVSERAGYPLFIPPDIVRNCCGTVWHSKGYNAGNILMANRVVENMWRWSKEGRLPIVCDASSCTLGLKQEVLDYLSLENRERHKSLTIYDSITWADEMLLPKLNVTRKARTATVHPTCSMHTLGIDTTLRKIAGELSEKPFYPLTSTCCAFAGDRGLLHEELTRSATREEAGEVAGKNLDLYLCANRTCEVGMEHATHAPYESFVYALEELTRER